jgi:hypothetical protein
LLLLLLLLLLLHLLRCAPGNVILSVARCCSSSLPSLLNRNTLKALCSSPRGCSGKNLQQQQQQHRRTMS